MRLVKKVLAVLKDQGPLAAVLWIGRGVWPYPHALVRAAHPRERARSSAPSPGRSEALHAFELELPRPPSGTEGDGELLARSLLLDPRDDVVSLGDQPLEND